MFLTQVARYRALRNNRGGYRPPGPPNKSAFGLQSGRAIARPLARYRALHLGAAAPPKPPRNNRGGYRPPRPPTKSAFGLQSGRAIARPLARYRALQGTRNWK